MRLHVTKGHWPKISSTNWLERLNGEVNAAIDNDRRAAAAPLTIEPLFDWKMAMARFMLGNEATDGKVLRCELYRHPRRSPESKPQFAQLASIT